MEIEIVQAQGTVILQAQSIGGNRVGSSSSQCLCWKRAGRLLFLDRGGWLWRHFEARRVSRYEMKLHRDEPLRHPSSCEQAANLNSDGELLEFSYCLALIREQQNDFNRGSL